MYAVISRDAIQLPPGTVVRMPGTWQDYQELCAIRGNTSIPRMKYLGGEILLMSPLPRHGREAHLLARIIEAILDSQNRNYEAFTPITMELPEEGGIEPDYCFYIDNWQTVVGKDRIQWETDPPPDLVVEIDVTSYTSAKDYQPFGVPEVWLLKKRQLSIFELTTEGYQPRSGSRYFPRLGLHEITANTLQMAAEQGSGMAIRNLRQQLM